MRRASNGALNDGPPSRAARLVPGEEGRLLIQPLAATGTPFPLPRMPTTLMYWCTTLATRFRRQHHACLAVVLLLDPELRRWSPHLPSQTCGRRELRWTLRASDYTELPDRLLVAGSFQSAPAGGLLDAHRRAPSFDGVHVVDQRRPAGRGRRRTTLFVRAAGREASLADPAAFTVDDVDAALRDAAARIRVR
jgi:hypothetical protein